ncbi:MAG: hypothetical protein D6808_00545 [Candidatus Dadabacteria bacterium]|nr:MAG: hypothetical protein D6808_00545 [Candidatus Dadabacteria bacterium]
MGENRYIKGKVERKKTAVSSKQGQSNLRNFNREISEEEFWNTLLQTDPNPMALLRQRHEIRRYMLKIQEILDEQIEYCKNARKKGRIQNKV